MLPAFYIDDKSQPGKVKDFIDLAANLTSINFGSNVGELVAFDVAFEATGQPLINRAGDCFLGNEGRILLSRKGSDQAFISLVDASDVRTDVNRFSVDFGHEQFITGDRVELKTLDGSDLNWVDDPAADDSFTRFVHVDAAGRMRLCGVC